MGGTIKTLQEKDEDVRVFVIIALIGLGLTFFGNLYEYVVFVPNLIGLGGIKGLIAFREFFTFSNPVYYYIPLGVIGFISTFISYARLRERSTVLNKWLKNGTVYGILTLMITVIIVTQFNFKLFFGTLPTNDSNLKMTLIIYYVVAFMRLFLAGLTLYSVFRAYDVLKSSQE